MQSGHALDVGEPARAEGAAASRQRGHGQAECGQPPQPEGAATAALGGRGVVEATRH